MSAAETSCLTRNRLFLVDGIISLPVALSGFFVLPDVPEISSPWYLNKQVSPLRKLLVDFLILTFMIPLGSCTGAKADETRGSPG